ncbi:MAG: 7-carboxy-7-deazaguanine synthase QueE [Thermoproteota archaeon]
MQGEGPNSGVRSVFVRLWGCNLSCGYSLVDGKWEANEGWKCDTTYSWLEREHYTVEPEELAWQLKDKGWLYGSNIVVTGGEPLIQAQNLAVFLRSVKKLCPETHVEVETNGTMFSEKLLALVDQWNVSPKLASSGNKICVPENSHYMEVLKLYFYQNTYYKFVVSCEEDLKDILSVVDEIGVSGRRVIVMPEGYTRQRLEATAPIALNMAVKHGWRYSDRLHIRVYGNRRGV